MGVQIFWNIWTGGSIFRGEGPNFSWQYKSSFNHNGGWGRFR